MGQITSRLLRERGSALDVNSMFADQQNTFDYVKMQEDPQVAAILLAITLPLLAAEWSILPATSSKSSAKDAEKSEEEVAKAAVEDERAKLLQKWLFSVEGGFNPLLSSCLTFLIYGYAVMEQVWEREDGLLRLTAVNQRAVDTLFNAQFDRVGKLTSVQQRITGGKIVTLPREKLLITTLRAQHGLDWRGRSLLFAARKPWVLKDMMERITTISHERWSMGIFLAQSPAGISIDSPDWQKGEEMLTALQEAERSWVQLPDGWSLSALERKVGTETPLEFIKYLDDAIARSVLAVHLSGQAARSNSGAASSTLTDLFLHGIQGYGDTIADSFTRDVIAPLYNANWGKPDGLYPRARASNIHGSSLERIGYLVQSGAMRVTSDLERFLYTVIGADYEPENVIETLGNFAGKPNNRADTTEPSDDADGSDGGE